MIRPDLTHLGGYSAPARRKPGAAPAAQPFRFKRIPAWARRIPATGYAANATAIAIVVLAVTAVRIHELVPLLMKLRPALLASVFGVIYVFRGSSSPVKASVMRDASLVMVLVYLGWCAFTVPFAYWPGGAFKQITNLATVPSIILAVLLCTPDRPTLERLILGGTVAAALYGLALLALGETTIDDRASIGLSLDSNDIAAMLAVWMPLAIGMFLRTRTRVRWIGLASAAVAMLAIAATGSRGGTLAVVAAALTFAAGYRGRKQVMILVILMAGGAATWQFASPSYRQRMIDLVEGKEDYNSTDYAGRKAIWRRAKTYAIENPITGVGVGNFMVAEGRTLEAMGHRGKWSAAHNAYYQAFAELGVPGGILFLLLLWRTGRRAFGYFRAPRRRGGPVQHMPELLASLVGFAIGSIFLSNTYSYTMFALIAVIAQADRTFMRERLDAMQAALAPPPAPVELQAEG